MPESHLSREVQAQKEALVETWDRRAEQWDSWTSMVDDWFGPGTKAMLAYLALRPGERVLELAAGTGGFTRHVARAVGPAGSVLATDSSPSMVRLAERNARLEGLEQISARPMDGELPDLPENTFDAIACRQGVMFFADPLSAFVRLRRVLRPDGRLVVSVFSTPERNAFMVVPTDILRRWAGPLAPPAPLPDGPGPFSLGAPGRIESVLAEAGFTGVETTLVPCPLRRPSMEQLIAFYRQLLGAIVKDLPEERQADAWGEVARACAPFVGPGSAGAPAEFVVAIARQPPAPGK